MKRGIITPTFEPHFKFVLKYLDSAEKYITDPENITFYFTVSEGDVEKLSKLLVNYKNKLNIKVLCFDELLRKHNVPYGDKKLLLKYGKFSYQTLKKFYTMLESDCDQMLVLDSESMFINKTNINQMFDNFFSSPFITVCNLDLLSKVGFFKSKVMENISIILDSGTEKSIDEKNSAYKKVELYNSNQSSLTDIWFLENFVWFYDKSILTKMFEVLGNPFSIIDNLYINSPVENREQGCFEICLYQGFIYKYNEEFNYEIIHTEELINDTFKDHTKLYQKYEKDYYSLWGGEFGFIEMAMALLTDKNYSLFAQSFKKYKFNIIRCDFTNLNNYKAQKLFLDILSPNILAASQNHIWGVNDTQRDKIWNLLVFNNSFARFIYKDLKNIMRPIKPLLIWGRYFYFLTKHSVLWLKGLLENIKFFKK